MGVVSAVPLGPARHGALRDASQARHKRVACHLLRVHGPGPGHCGGGAPAVGGEAGQAAVVAGAVHPSWLAGRLGSPVGAGVGNWQTAVLLPCCAACQDRRTCGQGLVRPFGGGFGVLVAGCRLSVGYRGVGGAPLVAQSHGFWWSAPADILGRGDPWLSMGRVAALARR